MGIQVHTIDIPDGLDGFAQSGWPVFGLVTLVPYASALANATSTVAVTIPPSANLPANFAVFVDAGADATAFVTAKTPTGFTVTVQSRLATVALAAGTVNLLIVA